MRSCRLLIALLAALALAASARQAPRTVAMPSAPLERAELDARVYGAPWAAADAQASAHAVRGARRGAQDVAGGPYRLDSGDKLRVVVFGQDALSNSYLVDADGAVALPLIGAVPGRGRTTAQLSGAIAGRLKQSYVREPSVAVEVETYRPFFVLGEVTYPGQYPYVPNMTAENAGAGAGGFTPRAAKDRVTPTRKVQGRTLRYAMRLQSPLRPGDTVTVAERWF